MFQKTVGPTIANSLNNYFINTGISLANKLNKFVFIIISFMCLFAFCFVYSILLISINLHKHMFIHFVKYVIHLPSSGIQAPC